jgi:hypothetical protein
MYKIFVGLTFAAILVSPTSAQDYNKNWVECARELGWRPDPLAPKKWAWNYNEAQIAAHSDCVARKASLASKPSGNVREGKGRR